MDLEKHARPVHTHWHLQEHWFLGKAAFWHFGTGLFTTSFAGGLSCYVFVLLLLLLVQLQFLVTQSPLFSRAELAGVLPRDSVVQ